MSSGRNAERAQVPCMMTLYRLKICAQHCDGHELHFQDVDPNKAAKPQQSAGEVVEERSAPPPAGQASNTFGALPADETV
jgi:hypothetical protein